MNRRDVLAGGLAALSAAMPAPRALAYPDRAIRLVVPFSPGGATDVVGRLWAEKMKPFLGTVVTENRGGGGGVTGAAEVARAQPDGHPFLFGNTSTQVLIPAIMHTPPTIRSRISSESIFSATRRPRSWSTSPCPRAASPSSSPTPGPIRASCPTARPAPAR